MYKNKKYWLGLSLINGIGPIRIIKLLKYFKSPKKVWKASKKQLDRVIGPGISKKIIKQRKKINLSSFIKKLNQKEIKYITLNEENYPENLKNIYDPPPVIYYQGILDFKAPSIAIVGSRKCTKYGRNIARTLARKLSQKGITIISGMARGIDTCSHKGVLKVKGQTIAVLGSGLDIIYPPENKNMFYQIQKKGMVISEFPPGVKPVSGNFPRRNRIISGLSMGTVVVEASSRSGSLITANLALEQGREVFAVPGNISRPQSKGTNNLIKNGAKMVTEVSDIIEEIFIYSDISETNLKETDHNRKKIVYPELSSDEEKVLKLLQKEETLTVNDIIEDTNMRADKVNTALLKLELKELISRNNGKKYSFKGLQNLLKPI
ncbi:MAG: DNA-processing protein DprA [Halanaerobiaceae bacterium]